MASGPDYASSIASATDLAGRSWAAWADNGQIFAARWDSAANRWGDAAVISNATGGRNVHLTAGQLLRDSKTGQDQPTLVVSWESGIDNAASVRCAVGIYRNDGTVLWSDALDLLPGGVAETNHSLAISGNRLVLATEAKAVVDPLASGPADGKPAQYQDSDINTYALALQTRSSTLASGDPAYVQQFSGSQWSGLLSTLIAPPTLSGGELINAAVNGIPLSLGTTTTIAGLGSFTLSKAGQLSFNRGSDPISELLFTAEVIGQRPGEPRSYARSSALLRPSELVSQATTANGNEGYSLSVSTLNGAGNVVATSSVPLTFNASERLERVSATTFAPSRPRSDGSALRDFTGSGQFSDASLERALAAANGQTSLERAALQSQALPGSASDWLQQAFVDPYVLNRGQVNRFGISLTDLLSAFTGGSSGSIPVFSNLLGQSGWNLGFDGLTTYNTSGSAGNQQLRVETGLNLNLGRNLKLGDNGVSASYTLSKSADPTKLAQLSEPRGATKSYAKKWQKSEFIKQESSSSKKQKRRPSDFDFLREDEGSPLSDRALGSATTEKSASNSANRQIGNEYVAPMQKSEAADFPQNSGKSMRSGDLSYDSDNSRDLSFNNGKLVDLYQNMFKEQRNLGSFGGSSGGSSAVQKSISITSGYVFNIFPLRAISLLFAARETSSYSTSRAVGLQDPTLQAKRFQIGFGVDLGFAGSIGYGSGKNITTFSLVDAAGEIGLKSAWNVGWGYSDPIDSLTPSLLWKPKTDGLPDLERAYLPFYENLGSQGKKGFKLAYYIATGSSLVVGAGNYLNFYGQFPPRNREFDLKDGSFMNSLRYGSRTKLGRATGGSILGLSSLSRAVSEFPFVYTAGDVLTSNLKASNFRNKGDVTVTFSGQAYLNAYLNLFNGLIGGYARTSAGLNFVIPNGIGYQYSAEVGYTLGGISQTLLNVRESGSLVGDASGFIANTFLESAPSLPAGVYAVPVSASAPLTKAISTPVIQLPASGGGVNLAALADPSLQAAIATPLANGPLALSVYVVVVAPSSGTVDANGNLTNFQLSFGGSSLPLRVSLDSRALLSGPERLAQPWTTLINQWATPRAATTTAALAGIKPGSAIPLRLDLRLAKGTNLAALAPLNLGYALDGAKASFGSASAPLLAAMPGTPERRDVAGSSYLLGTSASSTIGTSSGAVDPYIASFVVAASGSGYSDTDFILEQGAAVIRGRLNTAVSSGGVSSADIFQTASSTAFSGPDYLRLSDAALKARLSGGSDAQVRFTAQDGRLTEVSLALSSDGKTVLAGSGYLNGGSGVFSQWVSGTALNVGATARALLRLVVKDGSIAEVGILRQDGSFAGTQPAAISLTNSVAGAGSGLSLVPILRTSVDTNLLDDSGLSLGGSQRYVDGAFRSEADLVYTQGGPDRTQPINGALNLDTPLIVNRLAPDGRGWTKIAFLDPADTQTPGVDGFNFDSSSESLYFNNDLIGGKRSVVLFSHADLSAIQSQQDLYLLEDTLQQAQVYAALERKDAANNLVFGAPVLLSDPSQGGTNSNGKILPFYAVQGAGVAPLADANYQLLAAWVHTSPAGQAEIQLRTGSASGIATAGTKDTSAINWGPIRSIALPAKVTGNDVTELGLTYLDGRTPVLSWSLNSLTPYQAGVLRGSPTAYYRLDDLPSEGTIANISSSQQADGQLPSVGEIYRYSSWLDTSAAPLTTSDVSSGDSALLPADPANPQPGDPDPSLRFEAGVFAELPNVFLNRLLGLSSAQPSGYSADLWVNTSVADGEGSILDNGLYNPSAVLPTSSQLQLPVLLRRTASTETINGVDTLGYRYSLVVAAGTYADLGSDGFGSGLSPFNLLFVAPQANLSFSSSAAGAASFAFQGADLNDFVQYRTQSGKLSSFTLGDQEVVLGSSFVADPNSPGTTKTPEVITYDSLKLGLQSALIPGWSLRKRVVDGQQFVEFNYGIDKTNGTAATLSAVLPSGSWSHLAISYGEEQGTGTKAARLFIDGQLAAEQIEDPANLKGYDFNVLPYQLGYHFKGNIDELVLNDSPISDASELLRSRLATRFVPPNSATQATYFSPGVYDTKTASWSWQQAGPFIKADYIPSTIPGAVRAGPVDMATAASTNELRADGQADLHARLPLSGIAVGSLVTGIRARVTAADGSIREYAIGDGLRYGLNGQPSGTPLSGLLGVVASGTGLNSGAGGKQLSMAVMGPSADLDLYLPVEASRNGNPVEIVAFVRSPQNRAEGGDRFNVWPFTSGTAPAGSVSAYRATLELSTSSTVLSPYYSSKTIAAPLERSQALSLLDINTGFTASLAQTNEPTLAAPNDQVYAEALSAGSLKLSGNATAFLAIANPRLDGIAGSGKQRGVVWVLRNDVNAQGSTTAASLQGLQSLVGSPESRLDATQLQGAVIVGRDGMQLGGSILWADLDGDGSDELVIACPQRESAAGVAASGTLLVISGAFLASKAASGSKRIDLNDDALYTDSTKVRVFAGPDGSEFGTALAFGKVTAQGNALLIGAPGYSTKVTTNYNGATIALADQKTDSVGAIFQLNADNTLFSSPSTTAPFLLLSGDLPGLANFNSGADPTARRFGSAISLTAAAGNQDFNSDNIADIAIGIPGLVQSSVLKGGINSRATSEQRDAELGQRTTLPDVYREGIDETSTSDPKDVNMGGVLLLEGGAASADQVAAKKKVLLLGDTMFGDAAGAGAAIATGGDFNNDSIDDLAVGMPEMDGKTGAVSLISGKLIRSWFGSATATNYTDIKANAHSTVVDASLVIQNDQANGLYGRMLALNGDVNSDGIADLTIGDANFVENSGRVQVLFGSGNFGGEVKGQTLAKGPIGSTIYHRLDISNPNTRLDIYPGSFGEGLGRSILLAPTGASLGGTPTANLLLPSSNASSSLLTLYGKPRLKGLGSFSSRDLGSTEGVEIADLSSRSFILRPSFGLLGDINGDGNTDALVDLNPAPDQARFKISFGDGAGLSPDHQDAGTGGSSSLDLTGILRVQNPGATGFTLRNVRPIGDLNSDGISDLLIRYGYTPGLGAIPLEASAILLGGDLLTSNVLVQSAVLRPIAPSGTSPLDQAPFEPIGTAITRANGEAPTLLGVTSADFTSQLRWIDVQNRAVDIAALYDAWFAAFPKPASQDEQTALDSFNNSLKQQLKPFNPAASDAARVSADNLDQLTGTLESIVAGAGSSFRNYVEGQSPINRQRPVQLLKIYGDPPPADLFAAGSLPTQSGDVLLPGQRLQSGEYLLSANGLYMASMRPDGNFVVQARRSDTDAWSLSFSLDVYKDANDKTIVPTLPGTWLELRNGKLCFVNDLFAAATGSTAIEASSGTYNRLAERWGVNVSDLAPGTSLSGLRMDNDGVLRAKASDGSIVFNFAPHFDNTISQQPIPDDKLQAAGRLIQGYETLDLWERSLTLVDRHGDGQQELLLTPKDGVSDRTWYTVNLSGEAASGSSIWLATPVDRSMPSGGSFLWESRGTKPANLLSADQAGSAVVRTINGYTIGDYGPDQPVETGGNYGINGASLSRQMLYLGGIHQANSFGQYSASLGGADLKQRLSQSGDSFELKVPAYVWQMKSKDGGTPANEGVDELVLHVGSGLGIKDRISDTNGEAIDLDGLVINFNEYRGNLNLFWNGQRIFKLGATASLEDLAKLLPSAGSSRTATDMQQENLLMMPDGGLHNNDGINSGAELMSLLGQWFNNLVSSGFYLRYQQGAFSEQGKTYQGRLILEVANAMRYLPYEDPGSFSSNVPRLNSIDKGVQLSIPVEQAIKLNGDDVNLNAFGWSGGAAGLHALAGIEFNTDKPLEGTDLKRLTPVGDLDGDGYGDMVGLGSLASGWNYDYALDLPNNNLTERGKDSTTTGENSFTLSKGANGEAISRSLLTTPVIVWGGPGALNQDAPTPIVRGSSSNFTYTSKSGPLSAVDNFTAPANVDYTPIGDSNGDGFDDLAITDTGTGADGTTGSTYILYGGTGLRDAKTYLERFRAFFPETRAKDSSNLPIQVEESPDVYLTSNPKGFGIAADGFSTAWINAINLERSASDTTNNTDPAFGGVRVTKITGFAGQRLADLSGGGDFSGDGLGDLFLTSQGQRTSEGLPAPSRFVIFGGDSTRSVTLQGTPNNDSLKGTPVNDVILALAGNDIIQGQGGMDAINAGPGDDQIYVNDDQFRRIDGGSGSDTVILQGQRNQAWDFTKLAGRVRSIESIDLKDFGANSVTLNAASVRAITSGGRLSLDGDLQVDQPGVLLARALADRIAAYDSSDPQRKAVVDVGSRFAAFSFGLSDLSIFPVVVRDVQRDLVFDRLRALAGEPDKRSLDDLLERLDAIDAATPLQPGDTKPGIGLAYDFLQTFAQGLSFTPVSALDAYQAWIADLPTSAPTSYALLTAQQRFDLAGFVDVWKNAYAAYFSSTGQPPAALSFERFLQNSPTAFSSVADSYSRWLSGTGVPTYAYPTGSDSAQAAFLSQLNALQSLGTDLVNNVLASVDSVRLSAEFALINSDVQISSSAFSEYAANGGSARVLVPEWVAVLMDPAVPTTLTPTPATTPSSSPTAAPSTSLESLDPSVSLPVTLLTAPASRDDLRISVSESTRSADGRFLNFTLSRSGYLTETTRVGVNTLGYVADRVPSVQAQVVFAPGVTSQQVAIPLMKQLPEEQSSANPYDDPLSSEVNLQLTLLPAGSSGPRSTSVLGLNAINAYTPELDNPSRPLDASLLLPANLFSSGIALQFSKALWFTAEAINNAPIRFGLDTPQGTPLNDIQLLDRPSGKLVSLFAAAAAGEARIYGDNYLSPSTDLYFSVTDGGRFDQDGLANGQITLAADGALTSPGTLLIGDRVLRAPSSRGMNLLFTPPRSGFQGALSAYSTLLLVAADDTDGGLHQRDGSVLRPSDGNAYLAALAARAVSDAPLAAALRRITLDGAAASQSLNLLNDTNYVAVLARTAGPGPISAADLRLPAIRSLGSTSSRALASYGLELDGQRLAFSLSSPYFAVPGVEGSTLPLTCHFRAPSGRDGQNLSVAFLRVDNVDGDFSALLASADLASRLISLPTGGGLELQAGDLMLPVLFRGIEPLRWAALPTAQRLTGTSPAGWSVTLADPALDPSALLQRSDASSYRIGSDGLLTLRYGAALQASLGTGATIRGTAAADAFTSSTPALGLTFQQNLILTGDGDDSVNPAASAEAGANILLLGNGADVFNASRNDVAYSGAGGDQITLSSGGGNRVDGGREDDTFTIGNGGQRALGGDGRDSFRFSAPIAAPVVIAGGAGADAFWLTTTSGTPLGAPVVISDFDASEGDRLILPDTAFSDLSFQQIGSDVQISKGNTALAMLRNRSLEQISTASIFNFQPIGPQTSLSQSVPDPISDPSYGDGTLQPSDVISDGVYGLAAFAHKAFGASQPQLRVYLHNGADAVTIGGGKSGQQTINTVAINDSDAAWMRDQIRSMTANLGIALSFVSDKSHSNLDIYYDAAISLAPDRSTLGITLVNDNGHQAWVELLLNASLLSTDPSTFHYAFTHEMGHVLGLEHPFDNSDGDAEGQRFGAPDTNTTIMSYTRPSSGWTSEFQLLDWRALVSLWGLNPANSSGWRFRSADGTEVVLGNDQALARLAAPQSGDRFLGRADGLLLGAPAPATGTSPSSTPATNTSNTTPVVQAIIKTADSSSSGNSANPSLPLIVDTTPAAISATPGKIDWLPSWRQLDLELGVAVEADNTFQLLAPASYGLTPRGHQLLVDLQLTGSNDADVVFASAGSSIDLGLGQDTIVSRATDGGANHLYGGGQSDRFFLAAPGDIAYGGSRVAVGDQSTADSAANQFFIDLGARPTGYRDDPRARITIADFQPGLDRLTLIAGDPQQAAPLPISAVNYLEWRNRLAQEQNIQLNAAPQIRLARRGLAITAEMLANGYKLASDFFFTDADLAAGDAPALRLVGYDNSLPWLREVDGALEIAPGSSVAPGSYTLSLAATDGLSRSPVTTITLAVNPTVNIGTVSIPAGSSLRFQFPDIRDSALELLVQTFDENGLPINNPMPVAGQVGNSAGTPVGYNAFGSDAVAGDLFSSGRLAFFLRRADQSSALIPLRIQTSSPTGFDLQAADGTKVVATISNATAPDVLIGETSFGGVSVLGLFLPIPAGTAQGATRQVSVAVELFREAGFNSNLGFYLADRHTGAVIDSITGALLSAPALDDKDNPNPDYNAIAAAHTVFSGTVANRSHATLSQSFQLNASLQPDTLMLLPILEVDDPSGRRIYTAAAPVNPDQAAHVALMGYNTLGFEDMYKMGDGDLDDILAKVVGVTII